MTNLFFKACDNHRVYTSFNPFIEYLSISAKPNYTGIVNEAVFPLFS